MRAVQWSWGAAAVLLSACGAIPGGADAGPTDSGVVTVADSGTEPPDAGMPPVPQFVADPLPSGAVVWLKADVTNPAKPRLEVWGRDLALVRGVAFHVEVDPAQLRVDTAAAELVMGAGERILARVRGGDAAFGLVRLERSPAETDLAAETKLAVLQLTALTKVDSRPALSRVVVRRADGAYVAVKAAAGRLVLP